MGALTEIEIFDCLSTNLKLAAEHCERLAKFPLQGRNYDNLRKELRLIAGACRQAATWREDARWLRIGVMMGEAHDRAGGWLRGFKDPDTGLRIKFADSVRNPAFIKLAENLRGILKHVEDLRSKATGRLGMILPTPLAPPHRDTRPAGWLPTASGLIVPEHATVQ